MNTEYKEFLSLVAAYVDSKGKSGSSFIAAYAKWLSIFWTNRTVGAYQKNKVQNTYQQLIKDRRFKQEISSYSVLNRQGV